MLLIISGIHNSGKTSSLCKFLEVISDEYIYLNDQRPRVESHKYKDCVCLLKNKVEEKYLVVITSGDAERYVSRFYNDASRLLREHGLSGDEDNVFFVVASRSTGATIDFYLRKFGYTKCFSLLKPRSVSESENDSDNNYFALMIKKCTSLFEKGGKRK